VQPERGRRRVSLSSETFVGGLPALEFRPRGERAIWRQIHEHLLGQIRTGRLKPGAQLPGEHFLAQSLNVTRGTLRQALHQLQQEGHLAARKGVGIFVRSAPLSFTVRDGLSFADNLDTEGRAVATRTLLLERGEADAEAAAQLGIAEGAEIVRLARVRLIGGQPVYANQKIFPGARFSRFEAAYAPDQSVRSVFEAHGVARYRRAETRIRGGFASASEAAALNLSPAAPVFLTASVNEDREGRPIEWTRGCWPLTSVEFVFGH